MKTIIVDDEKQIREGLKILLSTIDTIDVVGEAASVETFNDLIKTVTPELVLLDIQLKNQTGFQLLEQLDHIPFKLIFVTAYDAFAIKAFKYNAFDYLLKPIDPDELKETIQRLLLQQETNTKKQLEILKENKTLNKIIIKTTEQIFVVPLNTIVRCEADQGYTHFYLKDGKHILSSKTLKEYNDILPEADFVRVHQSHLVNWNMVVSYDKSGHLILKNTEKIPVSVRKRTLVIKLLNGA